MEARDAKLKIAVIGAGAAGLAAAWALGKRHDVTLFEKNDYLGGHTNTRVLESQGADQLCIDTGFIVCNERNYPTFYRLLSQLGVSLRDTEMSFSYCCEQTGICYIGPGINEFVRVPENLLRPEIIKLLLERRKFNAQALKDLERREKIDGSLGAYVRNNGYSKFFMRHYLAPLSAAIWSCADEAIETFPTQTFLTFFRNHGMLQLSKRPQWQTVVGGSHSYTRAFNRLFPGRVRKASSIKSISRLPDQVELRGADFKQLFQRVVLACHADEALSLLADPSPDERRLLGKWRYAKNHVALHCDRSVMTPDRRSWASWNYYRPANADPSAPLSATYYMNRLQGLSCKEQYFVTLNSSSIDAKKTHYETEYLHPIYTSDSVSTQQELRSLNGINNTFYCGAYMGYGFHEDAVRSASDIAKALGSPL